MMNSVERKKFRQYKIMISDLQAKLLKVEVPDKELQLQLAHWQAKYWSMRKDAQTTSEVVSRQNEQVINLKQVIADQAEQIYNLEQGMKEVETSKGILQILFKGRK